MARSVYSLHLLVNSCPALLAHSSDRPVGKQRGLERGKTWAKEEAEAVACLPLSPACLHRPPQPKPLRVPWGSAPPPVPGPGCPRGLPPTMSVAVEIFGFFMAALGLVLLGVTLPHSSWRVSTVHGNVITTNTIFENLWYSCATDSLGVYNCWEFPSMLALSGTGRGADGGGRLERPRGGWGCRTAQGGPIQLGDRGSCSRECCGRPSVWDCSGHLVTRGPLLLDDPLSLGLQVQAAGSECRPQHLQLTGSVPWADDKMSFTDSSENQGYDRPGSQGGPEDYMR